MSEPKTKYIDDVEPTLEEMQKFVGGYIEVVTSADTNSQIVLDEEGKLKGKPINKETTEL